MDVGRLAWAALALGLAACGGKNKGAEEAAQAPGDPMAAKVDATLCEVEGKRVATFDLNRDGRPDVWKIYQTIQEGETALELLHCKQVDLDHDGRQEYAVAYNRKGGTKYETFDFDFDGRFDALFVFDDEEGTLVEVQRDSDFDGRFDLLEVYGEDEVVTAIKRDRNADGAPDLWEQYVGGELVTILYDDDFDNRVDRREETDVPAERAEGGADAEGSSAGTENDSDDGSDDGGNEDTAAAADDTGDRE